MLLAGDVGGTKTLLGLFNRAPSSRSGGRALVPTLEMTASCR
jgi:hypothetical protein